MATVAPSKVVAIIPARYGSTRFPGKPLADISGKPMIVRVYERALSVPTVDEVAVATDDQRIAHVIQQIGGQVIMTSPQHQSGTDRLIETMQYFEHATYFLNIQGDEPFINPQDIENLVEILTDADAPCIATLATPIRELQTLFHENSVKVVLNQQKYALYFSRSPIPFSKDPEQLVNKRFFLKHLGIYGYHRACLEKISQLPMSELEKAESLEQLRWLENGLSIRVGITEHISVAIDTPEDIQRALYTHYPEA